MQDRLEIGRYLQGQHVQLGKTEFDAGRATDKGIAVGIQIDRVLQVIGQSAQGVLVYLRRNTGRVA